MAGLTCIRNGGFKLTFHLRIFGIAFTVLSPTHGIITRGVLAVIWPSMTKTDLFEVTIEFSGNR